MLNQFSRTELLFGKEAMDILENSRVAVFGVGGVGGYTVERGLKEMCEDAWRWQSQNPDGYNA